MVDLTLEWNDKFNSLYNWYEINDLIADSEWDLPPQDLLDSYIIKNIDNIQNNIWTNKVHNTLKKVAQSYNHSLGIYDYRDKNEKNKVILYKNPDKIKKNEKKFWLTCDETISFIKKHISFEDAQDELFLMSQKSEDIFFLLETKNYKLGKTNGF
jgi:hypothetical protein